MSNPMTPKRFSEIENQLDELYNTASPDPAFAHRLEIQLAQRTQVMQAEANLHKTAFVDWLRGFFRRPALVVAFAVVALVFVSISLVGPQKVLAQVQRILGFAPGVGFINPGETRILPAPVEVKQGNVILRVERVVASAQQTDVTLQASGLPREKFDLGSAAGDIPQDAKPYLLLPDGSHLTSTGFVSGIGDVLQASLTFPPLPKEITQVTLVLPRLPSLPAGFAPENWSVALPLQNTRSPETPSAAGLPLTQPYAPENAAASTHGVTTRVLQVGQNPQETGLLVNYAWDNPAWTSLVDTQMRLSDETGHSYERHLSAMGPAFEPGSSSAAGSRTATYRFDPLEPQAKIGLLTFDQLTFRFTSQAGFTFNPGQEAADGQTWDLSQLPDSRLDLAGLPAQLLSLSISANPDASSPAEYRYLLTLLVQAPTTNGLSLETLALSLYPDRGMSGSSERLANSQFKLTIGIPELPKGVLHLYFPDGNLNVTGPWTMEWKIPAQH